jgi:glycosyltransferase involved in cell wall biosynthesis
MKLSIILPTRNGGAFLEECLKSALNQEAEDFEVVVSDNASDDATASILERYADDEHLRVVRQPEPLSVTDNWTAALEASDGDYVLLVGDDDYLLPGALARIEQLLHEYDKPDCLTFEAYLFAFPGALDDDSPAHYSEHLFPFDESFPSVGELPRALRRRIVSDFFRFEFSFSPNLQTTIVSRQSIALLRGGAFREPYPDFYTIYALMLLAERWVRVPDRLAVVGISPKSFGRTLKRGGSDEGRAYLQAEMAFEGVLPGSDMINGMYRTLEQLESSFRAELGDIAISRSNYVYRQAYSWYLGYRMGWIDRREVGRRIRMLRPTDVTGFAKELLSRFSPDMVRRHAKVDDSTAIGSVWPNMQPAPQFASITAFAEHVTGRVAQGK